MLPVLEMKKLLLRKVKVLGEGYIASVRRLQLISRSSDSVSTTLSMRLAPTFKCLKVMATVTDLTKVPQLVFCQFFLAVKT